MSQREYGVDRRSVNVDEEKEGFLHMSMRNYPKRKNHIGLKKI
jgi:hypothetical protein